MKRALLAIVLSISMIFAVVPVTAIELDPGITFDPIIPEVPDIPDLTLQRIILSDQFPVDRTLEIGETVGFSTSLDASSEVTENLEYEWYFIVEDVVYSISEGDEMQGCSFEFANKNLLRITAEADAVSGEYGVYCIVSSPLSISATSRVAVLTVNGVEEDPVPEEEVEDPAPEEEEEDPVPDEEEEDPVPDEEEETEEIPYMFPFTDVADSSWYRNDVEIAHKNGLIDGKTPTLYYPDDNMTVAEAIKLAASMHQLYYDGVVTLTNGSPNWYSSYVNYALAYNIIDGEYPDYNAKVSREEFVHIFYSALPSTEYGDIKSVGDGAIPDVPMSGNYAGEIYGFYRAGILTGSDSAGTFNPESNIKRSEVAAILTRMFDSSVRKSITLPAM
ncbi:S-layer homology domain-containing protein [Gudongella sp. DL1XJH-153]|uniref:S-layer homology domain-containing protein n=1 Tax=Gudongella sp. DL1XJH-153 TaxID=3409804 RepID=UPI003BB49DA7